MAKLRSRAAPAPTPWIRACPASFILQPSADQSSSSSWDNTLSSSAPITIRPNGVHCIAEIAPTGRAHTGRPPTGLWGGGAESPGRRGHRVGEVSDYAQITRDEKAGNQGAGSRKMREENVGPK